MTMVGVVLGVAVATVGCVVWLRAGRTAAAWTLGGLIAAVAGVLALTGADRPTYTDVSLGLTLGLPVVIGVAARQNRRERSAAVDPRT